MTSTLRFLSILTIFVSTVFVNNPQAVHAQTKSDRSDDQRPNVIFIFADDLGPGMLGCYGQQVIETPNIDRLADQGMKFTNYYGSVYCAPARWTLMTGMHDGRNGRLEADSSGPSNSTRCRADH